MTRTLAIVGCLYVATVGACAPQIGDTCTDALDCAVDGTRVCDTTQEGGYCLIPNCRPDECPEESVCVRFGVDERARAFCLRGCEGSGDCPGSSTCTSPDPSPSSDAETEPVATAIVDEAPTADRYCIASAPGSSG